MTALHTRRMAIAILLSAIPTAALAHDGRPPAPHDIAGAWPAYPGVLLPLFGSLVLYLVGVRRLRQRAGAAAFRGRTPLFIAGWLVLANGRTKADSTTPTRWRLRE